MLKKTITYTDYNDVERTEDFYFNITKAEAMEMEFSVEGGLTAMIDEITAAKDFTSLVSLFKEFIISLSPRPKPPLASTTKIIESTSFC